MSGKLLQRSISKVLPNKTAVSVAEILLLFLAGVLVIVLHARFRTPLRQPGHHGLEFMMIFIFMKQASRFTTAASISSVAAGMMALIPVLGFKDPFMAIVFFIPGIFIDFLYKISGNSAKRIIIIALIAGISYATIPLTRFLLSSITGFPYGSLMGGLLYPLSLHFVFGFTGGLLGAGLYRLFPSK